MRVVSMVPSWTETLLEVGANVVGRTRFCIHPGDHVRRIPVVGGTKDIDWGKVRALKPDLILLDREENPLSMAEESPVRFHASHVTSAKTLPIEIEKLSATFTSPVADELLKVTKRWQKILARRSAPANWASFPGVMEWIKCPGGVVAQDQVCYIIWKDPYMMVAPDTFVGSMLEQCGVTKIVLSPNAKNKYPEVTLDEIPKDSVVLFSSEPFPFHKKKSLLPADRFRGVAIVDGESFSWFGLRSLRFLEQSKRLS